MSDEEYILSRSQDYGRHYCPDCQPDLDPLTGVWLVCYCTDHAPGLDGTADAITPSRSYVPLIGSDMEGHANRAWCDLLHRSQESSQ